MGITSKLDGFPSEVIGGLKYCCTMLEMADAYATLANGGIAHPRDDPQQGRVPERQGRRTSATQPQPRVQRRRGVRGHPGAEDRDPERDRHRRQLRLPGRRQDRNGRERGQRLVRGLHAQAVDRGLGRLPAGQHPDGVVRVRRDGGRADLARLHAEGLEPATAATSRSRPPRSPARRSPARTRRPRRAPPTEPPDRPGRAPTTTRSYTRSRRAAGRRPTTTSSPAAAASPAPGGTGGGGGGHGNGGGRPRPRRAGPPARPASERAATRSSARARDRSRR